jgi:hypothetical protein
MVPLISDIVFGLVAAVSILVVVGAIVFFLYDTVATLLEGRV